MNKMGTKSYKERPTGNREEAAPRSTATGSRQRSTGLDGLETHFGNVHFVGGFGLFPSLFTMSWNMVSECHSVKMNTIIS